MGGLGDLQNVDEVAGHVEKLVEGWASVNALQGRAIRRRTSGM